MSFELAVSLPQFCFSLLWNMWARSLPPPPIHWGYLTTSGSHKWHLKGSHPQTWMILCAVMLHAQFVGIVCGSHWNHLIPLHACSETQQASHDCHLKGEQTSHGRNEIKTNIRLMDTLCNLTASLVDSQEEEDYMAWQQAVAHTATKFLSPGSMPQQKSAINSGPEESKFLVPSSGYNSSMDLSMENSTNSFSFSDPTSSTTQAMLQAINEENRVLVNSSNSGFFGAGIEVEDMLSNLYESLGDTNDHTTSTIPHGEASERACK